MLDEIIFNEKYPFGIQKIYKFKNGFGASVICHKRSYGGGDGLWELAVLNKSGNLDFDTPITKKDSQYYSNRKYNYYDDGVLGWLTEKDVDNILEEIKQLKGE